MTDVAVSETTNPAPDTEPAVAMAPGGEPAPDPTADPVPAPEPAPEPTPEPAPAAPTEEETAEAKARRGRGELEADVKVICDQFVTGNIALDEGDHLTAHKIATRIKEMHTLEAPPSSGAVTAVLDRWKEVGYAVLNEKPKAFTDYTTAGRTEGLTALKAKAAEEKRATRAATKLANKAAAAAAAPATEATEPTEPTSADEDAALSANSSAPAPSEAAEPAPVPVTAADSPAVTASEDVPF